jgi:hypothetical protein
LTRSGKRFGVQACTYLVVGKTAEQKEAAGRVDGRNRAAMEGVVLQSGLLALGFADPYKMISVNEIESCEFAAGGGEFLKEWAGGVHEWDLLKKLQGMGNVFEGQMVAANLVQTCIPKAREL